MKEILNPSPMDEKYEEEFDGKELAERVKAKFPNAAIVLTMGSRGSVCVTDTECIRQPVYKVETIDTTAAGDRDTFTGYFLGGLLAGKTLADSMKLAAKAAAIAVSRAGAAPSIPDMAEVSNFLFP